MEHSSYIVKGVLRLHGYTSIPDIGILKETMKLADRFGTMPQKP